MSKAPVEYTNSTVVRVGIAEAATLRACVDGSVELELPQTDVFTFTNLQALNLSAALLRLALTGRV